MPSTPRRAPRPPGPPPQTSKRDLYVRLMTQGMSNSEACRTVGINRRTGTRWLHGRTVNDANGATYEYPAIVPIPDDEHLSSRYLSQEERDVIADGVRAKSTIRAIAANLGRAPSTVSRELARNRDPATGVYRPRAAHRAAAARRARPKARKLTANIPLRDAVQTMLKRRCSPEQISNRLPLDFPDQPLMRIAPETVYQTLYDPGDTGLARELTRRLRTGRTHRKPRRHHDRRRNRYRAPMKPIHDRPAEADDRQIEGHWEGDLVVGTANRSAIGTLVERTSRYTILVHMIGRATAEDFADSLVAAYKQIPSQLKRSLAWDQGTELACHDRFEAESGIPVFFCDPHSPWQRGTNENTNGLLRQYFPKGTDLTVHSPQHLTAVADELNHRPRKSLGWRTPIEHLATLHSYPLVATIP